MLAKPAAQWFGPLTTAQPIRSDRRCLHDDLGPPAARYARSAIWSACRRTGTHVATCWIISRRRINVVEIVGGVVCVLTMRRQAMTLSACIVLGACGDNLIELPDASMNPQFTPAPHAPMPRVFPHNGVVLANLRLVTLAFDGFDTAMIDHFGDAIVGSSWYTTVGAEYGIRAGSHSPTVTLGAAPTSLTRYAISELLKQRIAADSRLPKPVAGSHQLLYLVFVPSSATRGTDASTGYHASAFLGNAKFPFAVVIDDGSGATALTVAASRLLINAVTNPYPPAVNNPYPDDDGYYVDPPKIDPWSLVRREVADLCDGQRLVTEGDLTLPQVYSDVAARAGTAPCMPSTPDDAWSDVSAEPSTMRPVPRGGSVTFVLTGWSTQEVPSWELRTRVADFSQLSEEEMLPVLSDNQINNNTTVKLTLHAPLTAPSGAPGGVYVLSGENGHPWAVGFVVR